MMNEEDLSGKIQELHQRLLNVNDELEQQQRSVADKLNVHQAQVSISIQHCYLRYSESNNVD